MAGRPLSALLVGSAHDVKEHLRPVAAAVVTEDVASSVKSLLECLSGTGHQLRGACGAWGIPAKKHGKHLARDALKEALLEKLLTLLPPVSFGSLLGHVQQEDVHGSLADYKDALVAATDAKRVLELLMALGPVQRGGDEAFKRICSAWKVQVQQGRKRRPQWLLCLPKDLEYAIEKLYKKQNLSKKEQLPWMTLAGCKPRRRLDGKEVHPSSAMTVWETERAAVERLRVHLRLDPECRAGYRGPEFSTLCTLEDFAQQLQSE